MTQTTKITVIGGANLDIIGTSTQAIIAADSNPGTIATAAGGVGRNIAENLARLNNPTALVTMVGDDMGKQVIEQSCDDCGINRKGIIVEPRMSTGTYLAVTDNQGNLSVAINDMSIIDHFTAEVIAASMPEICNGTEIIVEANLPQDTLNWIAENYDNRPLHADAVSETKAVKLRAILSRLDILKVNRHEAAVILSVDPKQFDDKTLAKQLYAQGVKKVLLSLGADGVLFYNGERFYHQTVLPASIASDNGGGDALLAGFVTAQSLFAAVEHQLVFAMACAATTLSCAHAVNPQLSLETIKHLYYSQIPSGVWY